MHEDVIPRNVAVSFFPAVKHQQKPDNYKCSDVILQPTIHGLSPSGVGNKRLLHSATYSVDCIPNPLNFSRAQITNSPITHAHGFRVEVSGHALRNLDILGFRHSLGKAGSAACVTVGKGSTPAPSSAIHCPWLGYRKCATDRWVRSQFGPYRPSVSICSMTTLTLSRSIVTSV